MALREYESSSELGSRVELYLFESDDGRYRWAYTTDSRDRILGPVTYKPEIIKRTPLKQTTGDANVETVRVTVPYDNPVAAIHVPYLPPRPIRLTIYAYHRTDPAAEVVQAFTGFVASFKQQGAEAELECSQILDTLGQVVPWVVFKGDCVWALYQIGCGVDKALYRENALVTGVTGYTIASPEFANKPDGWYTNGFAIDPETGEQRFITSHNATAGTITVVYPFQNLQGGDTLEVLAGCSRHRDVCSTKFNNKINYVGFDHFPMYNVFQQGIT